MRWMTSSPITTGRSIIPSVTLVDRAASTGRPSRIRFAVSTGSPVLKLPLADRDDTPPAAILFGKGAAPPRPFTLDALGLFFELSMGLSARKEIPGMSWYLRMNPSSGNLHPTEAYAVLPALEWLPGGAGVYHYAPLASRPGTTGAPVARRQIRTRSDFAWD